MEAPMGCWNQTCAITNLPILHGDAVVGLILVESSHNALSLSKYHTIMPFYFEGEYDDYGGVEKETGKMIPVLMSALSKKVVEVTPKEEYVRSDIKVSREDFDFDMFITSSERGKLFVNLTSIFNKEKKQVKVDHVQIHKSAFDDIIERYSFKYYDYELRESKITNFDTVMSSFGAWVEKMNFRRTHGFIIANDDTSTEIGSLLSEVSHTTACPLLSARNMFSDIIKTKKGIDGLYESVENFIKVRLIQKFLMDTGRQIVVPGHLGQCNDTGVHELLASITVDTAEFVSGRYDDE